MSEGDDPSLPSCSDLIGASVTQTGGGVAGAEPPQRGKRKTPKAVGAEGRLPIPGSSPPSRPQRTATAKAVSPFSKTSHVLLRWNVATVSVPTACGALLVPLSCIRKPVSVACLQ